MTDLTLGILLWNQASEWGPMGDAARRVDELGYDSLLAWDHIYAIYGDPYQPIFDGYTLLSAYAMVTERTKLGLLVGANTFRNPGLVAKTVTTLDHISGGRAVCGIGGAWFELEHTAHGFEFGSGFGQRLDWLDESVSVVRRLLDGREVTFESAKYHFQAARHNPLPIQRHLPILIGGGGEKKTLRTVAKYADIWNVFGTPETVARKDGILREHCADVGRDPDSITRTVGAKIVIRDSRKEAERVWAEQMVHNKTPREGWDGPETLWLGTVEDIADTIRGYVGVGFEEVLVEMPAPYDMETIERLIGEVKPIVDRG